LFRAPSEFRSFTLFGFICSRTQATTPGVLWCSAVLSCSLLTCVPARSQAHSHGGSSFAALAVQADQARQADRLEEALALYAKALVLRPNWTEGWFSVGTIEYDRSSYSAAVRAFHRVAALDPKAGTARVMLGLSEFELGQDAAALKHIQEGKSIGIAQSPQLRRVMLYHEGVLLLRARRFENAQTVLDSLSRDGADDDVLLALGQSVLRMDQKAAPPEGTVGRKVVVDAGRAESLAAQKKIEEARQAYGELVANYPDYRNIHYALARFLLQVHDTDAAVTEFQREIAGNPDDVTSRLEIAAVKYRVNSAEGLPYAVQAVNLAPRIPFGHYLLGLLLVDMGEFQRAIPELETARKAFPAEPNVYFALGNAYARAGRKADATQARETFKRLDHARQAHSSETIYGQQSTDPAQDKMHGGADDKPPA
jgi:tetratricopeptide (TPR) repeat protein